MKVGFFCQSKFWNLDTSVYFNSVKCNPDWLIDWWLNTICFRGRRFLLVEVVCMSGENHASTFCRKTDSSSRLRLESNVPLHCCDFMINVKVHQMNIYMKPKTNFQKFWFVVTKKHFTEYPLHGQTWLKKYEPSFKARI